MKVFLGVSLFVALVLSGYILVRYQNGDYGDFNIQSMWSKSVRLTPTIRPQVQQQTRTVRATPKPTPKSMTEVRITIASYVGNYNCYSDKAPTVLKKQTDLIAFKGIYDACMKKFITATVDINCDEESNNLQEADFQFSYVLSTYCNRILPKP